LEPVGEGGKEKGARLCPKYRQERGITVRHDRLLDKKKKKGGKKKLPPKRKGKREWKEGERPLFSFKHNDLREGKLSSDKKKGGGRSPPCVRFQKEKRGVPTHLTSKKTSLHNILRDERCKRKRREKADILSYTKRGGKRGGSN